MNPFISDDIYPQGTLSKEMFTAQELETAFNTKEVQLYSQYCGGDVVTKPVFYSIMNDYVILADPKALEVDKLAAQEDAFNKLSEIQIQCEAKPEIGLSFDKIMIAAFPREWEPLKRHLMKDRKGRRVADILNKISDQHLSETMSALLAPPPVEETQEVSLQCFARATRRYFAVLERKGNVKVNVQQTIGKVKPVVQPRGTYYDITPILDRTQIYNLAEGESELTLPKKLFTDLNIKEDDEQVFTDSLSKMTDLWMLLNGQASKDWVINKCDPAICAVIEKELQSRPKERIKVLAWIADSKNQFYVFLMVAPAAIKGVVKFKIQEQTYRSAQIDNTSVSAITYKDGDEELNYDVTPVIEEFAKEDHAVKTDFEAMKDAAESAAEDEYDEFALDDEELVDKDESDESPFGEDSDEGSEEESEDSEKQKKSKEKNFSRHWYGYTRW